MRRLSRKLAQRVEGRVADLDVGGDLGRVAHHGALVLAEDGRALEVRQLLELFAANAHAQRDIPVMDEFVLGARRCVRRSSTRVRAAGGRAWCDCAAPSPSLRNAAADWARWRSRDEYASAVRRGRARVRRKPRAPRPSRSSRVTYGNRAIEQCLPAAPHANSISDIAPPGGIIGITASSLGITTSISTGPGVLKASFIVRASSLCFSIRKPRAP